ncbi:MAG: hypothetical protein BGO98_46705 [Myxococcales bacterium 68-20]|nr:MAG: hypothetical protein BGO98_46705 [Myxococcales bacterium 68-20]
MGSAGNGVRWLRFGRAGGWRPSLAFDSSAGVEPSAGSPARIRGERSRRLRDRVLVARRSSLVARRSSLVARRSSLVARRSSLVARRSSLVARRSSLVARRSRGERFATALPIRS